MDDHRHGPDGEIIMIGEPVEETPAAAVEEAAAAGVEIARIEADRDVELAKLAAKVETEDTTELDQLRGEVRALREIVERIAPPVPEPEPEPEPPVILDLPPAPDPEPEAPEIPEPPEVDKKPPAPRKKNGFGWFS